MYVFGGHDIKEGSLDSLWMIDIGKLNNDSDENDNNGSSTAGWIKLETVGKDKPSKT
jgi:hypothetical protein